MPNKLDFETTEHDDLRGGSAPWNFRATQPAWMRLDRDLSCDIVIVGAGITGAIVAERLTRMNLNVCVVDRQKPSMGSTAASTAMLQWELDTSLTDLTDLYGFERAASIFHRSLAAANGLQAQIRRLGISCQFRPRSSLYLAANEISASDLLAGHRIRERAGLPGVYLHHRTLMSEFGIAREAAILSPGSSEADPVMLNRGFLDRAVERGARIFEGTVSQFHEAGKEAIAEMENGKIVAGKHLVLATGYVMPDFVPSDLHEVASTWAIATGPQPDRLWRDGVLIWEASEQYSYLRTTWDGRIIIGGEDDAANTAPEKRDGLIPEKTARLLAKLNALWPRTNPSVHYAWAGAFGRSVDGLPLIGTVPGRQRTHAAYGYGGNGITFSYMASHILADITNGRRREWFGDVALDRSCL